MQIELKENSTTYLFTFEKNTSQKKKNIFNIHSQGKISVNTKLTDKVEKGVEYSIRTEEYKAKEVKEPLVFNPVKWIFSISKNEISIKAKDNLRLIWNRYRDKYRRKENSAFFMAIERLYFHTHQGLENSALSECPYIPFFINYFDKEIEKDIIIKGCDLLLIPLNIPLNTSYKISNIDNGFVILEGWVSLDEEKLDLLLTKERFRERAHPYHFSKNFTIDSVIKVWIDINTSSIHFATFNLEIDGEGLHEIMKYEINSEITSNNSWVLID